MKPTDYENALLRGQLLRGDRIIHEGIALWNDAADRIARRLLKKLQERNKEGNVYYFDGLPYTLLNITCEATEMFASSWKEHIKVHAYFMIKDFVTDGLPGTRPTKKEAQLLKEIQDVLLRRQKAYDGEYKTALLGMAMEIQGNSWHGLKSLKNGFSVIGDMEWELDVVDFIKGKYTTDMRLNTGKDGYGNTALI